MQAEKTIIIGAGVTGLAAGIKTGAPIYEANSYPGGICRSYIKNGYRFEFGGGRWIFGSDRSTLDFINSLSPLKKYQRQSAVWFPQKNLCVPYPLQNHLSHFPREIARKALEEIVKTPARTISSTTTLKDWLEINFGKTLCRLFFFPFHQLYTAGLYTKIAPQDPPKSPLNKNLIIKGAKGRKTPKIGYNKTFFYPKSGLSELIENMAGQCKINYNKRVTEIDIKKKKVLFEDGTKLKYKKIISTLPLNKMVRVAKVKLNEPTHPYTSVVVVNIGAKRGKKCPLHHWFYIPKSRSGFYRVGFYSNVEPSFLPASSRNKEERVSLYVDKAYPGGNKPAKSMIRKASQGIVQELKDWEFITKVEIADPTWIDVAYTWHLPNSNWRKKALKTLRENDVLQIGRYGRWKFQGILDSIKEGLSFSEPARQI